MKIQKKVKCVHCGQEIQCTESSCSTKCGCGKVSVVGTVITEGVFGKDYIDITPQLLNG
tara:strand:+ start:11036 stop:11212 length:177 start_codon:yes stop_codon:yes gene_type:complete